MQINCCCCCCCCCCCLLSVSVLPGHGSGILGHHRTLPVPCYIFLLCLVARKASPPFSVFAAVARISFQDCQHASLSLSELYVSTFSFSLLADLLLDSQQLSLLFCSGVLPISSHVFCLICSLNGFVSAFSCSFSVVACSFH